MANRDEIAAAMARIKALQDELNGVPSGAEDDDYDPNDPNQNPEMTAEQMEEDERWREEQEKIYEAEQKALREEKEKEEKEKTEKAAAEAAATPAVAAPADATKSADSAAAASVTSASAGVAVASVPPPSTVPSILSPSSSVGPHHWSTQQLTSWLTTTVRSSLLKRADLFERKGWTNDELTKWKSEVDVTLNATAAKITSSSLTGEAIAKWELTNDSAWQQHLGVEIAYHRAAMWAEWKRELREWQAKQQTQPS